MIKRKTNGSSCVIVKLIHKPHRKDNAFAMNTVTQTMKFRQSLLSYTLIYYYLLYSSIVSFTTSSQLYFAQIKSVA